MQPAKQSATSVQQECKATAFAGAKTVRERRPVGGIKHAWSAELRVLFSISRARKSRCPRDGSLRKHGKVERAVEKRIQGATQLNDVGGSIKSLPALRVEEKFIEMISLISLTSVPCPETRGSKKKHGKDPFSSPFLFGYRRRQTGSSGSNDAKVPNCSFELRKPGSRTWGGVRNRCTYRNAY